MQQGFSPMWLSFAQLELFRVVSTTDTGFQRDLIKGKIWKSWWEGDSDSLRRNNVFSFRVLTSISLLFFFFHLTYFFVKKNIYKSRETSITSSMTHQLSLTHDQSCFFFVLLSAPTLGYIEAKRRCQICQISFRSYVSIRVSKREF